MNVARVIREETRQNLTKANIKQWKAFLDQDLALDSTNPGKNE
jgi:hypothetical protein